MDSRSYNGNGTLDFPLITIGEPPEWPDLTALTKFSKALSDEIVVEKRIEILLRTAIQHAGSERGLLIIQQGREHWIQGEAISVRGKIIVLCVKAKLTSMDMPEALVDRLARTHASVIISDTSIPNILSDDVYIRRNHPKTVLCVPLLKQNKLLGLLYLENKRVYRVIDRNRLAGLELIASQAALSFQQASLHSELVHSKAQLKRETLARQRAEDALRKAQATLAHVSRVTTLGQLTASIAHEINQPITAIISNADATIRWLARESPDVIEAGAALRRILRDGNRMADIIARMRTLLKRGDTTKDSFDFNDAVEETIALTRSQVQRCGVTLKVELHDDLPLLRGDRVQLQQVVLNLLVNACEAMNGLEDNRRELHLTTQCMAATESELQSCPDKPWIQCASGYISLTVSDSGPGLPVDSIRSVFTPFYTTKSHGLGIRLAISRSIVEAHGGRLWAHGNLPRGAVFRFALPLSADA